MNGLYQKVHSAGEGERKNNIGVSMDTGTLAQQVENVERNIAFLQKEHQVLLTGLRLEIRQLKKRCNDLSCELSKRPPGRSKEDITAEEELLQVQLSEMEDHLAEQECSQGQLRAKLQQKGTQAVVLQVRLRDEERRFLEELKRRSHKITALGRDLRKQTDIAAQLAFQLHSARFRLYHQTEEGNEEQEDTQETGCSSSSHQDSPARAETRHRSHSSARMRRLERARECVPRERVLGPEDPQPMPDPALFLYPFRHRLLPLHTPVGGRWREGGLTERSNGRMGRLRPRSMREDTGTETTEL